MIQEQIILIAIENGYEPIGCDFTDMPIENRGVLFPKTDEKVKEADEYDYCIYDTEYPEEGYFYSGLFNSLVLDPLFWQALGKGLGWKNDDDRQWAETPTDQPWFRYSMRYFSLLFSGGNLPEFWESLLNNK